jgi:hypothetical protein
VSGITVDSAGRLLAVGADAGASTLRRFLGPLDFTTGSAVAVAPTDEGTVFAGSYSEFALTGRTMRALIGRLH